MKFKSKSLISIILSIMMVISMILVAIPANAAVVDSEPVGAGTYYLWYSIGNANLTDTNAWKKLDMTSLGNSYVATVSSIDYGKNVYFIVNNDSTHVAAESSTWSESEVKTYVTYDSSVKKSDSGKQQFNANNPSGNNVSYYYPFFSLEIKQSILFTFTPTKTVLVSEAPSFAVNFGTGGTGTGDVIAEKSDSTTIESGSQVESGTSVTFKAKPDANSTFAGWYSDSDCTEKIPDAVQTNSKYEKAITGNTNVYAKFDSVPSLTSVTLSANSDEVTVGDSITLTATVAPSTATDVKYTFYQNNEVIVPENTTESTITVTPTTAGDYTYKVKAICGSKTVYSKDIKVKVNALSITGVTLISSTSSVNLNEEFTLTATASPAGVTDVTYTFYKDGVVIPTDGTSNILKTKLTEEGSAKYTVKATANGITVTSKAVTVTASAVAQTHNLTVYFKCASAPAYKPYVSLDGAKAFEMTKGTDELGKNYAGTLTFYWYSYTFNNVNSANTHTLTFTSKKTKLNATITDNFANLEYYLAVDNLMTGTEVVDLTGSPVYVRNFFHTATNTVYSGVGTDKTLGFTNINGTRYKMGTKIDENGSATFSIKSATTMQMLTAELTTVSETQQAILDVNLDGKVDVKDATLMQRALAS